MSKIYLDLTEFYNHKMVLKDDTKIDDENNVGISKHCILERNFEFGKVIKNGENECVFRKNEKGQDNVVCCSQVLKFESVRVKKITIFGFCCWGYYKEYFTIKCTDGTFEKAKAYFSDFNYPCSEAATKLLKKDKEIYFDSSRIFCELGMNTKAGSMYYYTTEFAEPKEINQIIFPDNCFMNIFAITLETEEVNDKNNSSSRVSELYQEYKRQLFCKNTEK